MIAARQGCRVALVEDHALFAESMEIALSMDGHDVRRIRLPESGRNVSSLLSRILRTEPQIVLLDLDLGPHGNAVPLIEPLTRSGTSVVVVTGSLDRVRWGECVRLGARKVLGKQVPLEEIRITIRRLRDGLPVMTPHERHDLVDEWRAHGRELQRARGRLDHLTHRESEVLAHLMEGRDVREIARIGVVSEATVRTQVKSILSKLEVSSQLAAVSIAHLAGWRLTQGPRRRRGHDVPDTQLA